MKLEVSDIVNKESYSTVVDILVEFNNKSIIDQERYVNKPIEIIAKSDNGDIIGGIYGRSIWGTLEIKTLAVDPDYRLRGVGKKLIKEASIEAKKRKCDYISLDTFSFQAPGFYKKLGFEEVGVETNHPKGHNKYYFRKQIGCNVARE